LCIYNHMAPAFQLINPKTYSKRQQQHPCHGLVQFAWFSAPCLRHNLLEANVVCFQKEKMPNLSRLTLLLHELSLLINQGGKPFI